MDGGYVTHTDRALVGVVVANPQLMPASDKMEARDCETRQVLANHDVRRGFLHLDRRFAGTSKLQMPMHTP